MSTVSYFSVWKYIFNFKTFHYIYSLEVLMEKNVQYWILNLTFLSTLILCIWIILTGSVSSWITQSTLFVQSRIRSPRRVWPRPEGLGCLRILVPSGIFSLFSIFLPTIRPNIWINLYWFTVLLLVNFFKIISKSISIFSLKKSLNP